MRSVLLLGADYYGTLAAARCYGRAGIRVAMADEHTNARAMHSRYVSEKLAHPPMSQPDALIDWLCAYGERHPDTFLYPPNDHLAWLFAVHRERLAKAFVIDSPSEQAILALLDKKRLHDACAHPDVGIDVPVTHALGAAGMASSVVDSLRYPVLLKPRTQVFLQSGIKGFIVSNKDQLGHELEHYRSLASFHRVLTEREPDIQEPMVQQYLTAAETNIFSVSGFVSKDGSIVARAAMKVLQRPRKVGIGLCFEGREVDTRLVEKLTALCRTIGYYGAFESEFIVQGDKRLLIDFNPRFYSQMGFDIARGMAIPLLVFHAAHADASALSEELTRARAWKATGREVYCHKTMLDLVLALQGMSGQMRIGDALGWRRWHHEHRATATDAVRDADDRKPALVDAAAWARHFATHPRSFVRSFVLNR
jgi:predicted ATP-grasp superfamily ATP-dependent carboligase